MTNLLSVTDVAKSFLYTVRNFDREDYSLHQSFEEVVSSTFHVGGQAVRAIEQVVETHGVAYLYAIKDEIRAYEYESHDEVTTDFSDVESVANSFDEFISRSIYGYIESLNLNNNAEIEAVLKRIISEPANAEILTLEGDGVMIHDSGDTTFIDLLAERYDGHLYFYNGFDEPKALAVNDTIIESNYLGDVTADFLEELREWKAEGDESLQCEQPFAIPFGVWFEPTLDQLREANVSYGLDIDANLANRLKGGEAK